MYESDITMHYNKEKFWKNSLKILNKFNAFDRNFNNSLTDLIKSNNSLIMNSKRINLIKKN